MMISTVSQGDEASRLANLLARHLPQRFSVPANGCEENDEVLHRAAQHRADNDPQRARKISELRGKDRADERSGAGNGGKMMSEDDPFIGGFVIVTVAQPFRWSGAPVVQRHHAHRDEPGIETIAREISAGCRHHHPETVDGFAPFDGNGAQTQSCDYCDHDPDELLDGSFHGLPEHTE